MSVNWENIEDNTPADTLRTRFNNFLNAVANFINNPSEEDEQSKWEAHGANDIKPKEAKNVFCGVLETSQINIGDGYLQADSANVFIPGIATAETQSVHVTPSGQLIGQHQLPSGHTLTVNVDLSGGPHEGSGWLRKTDSQDVFAFAPMIDNVITLDNIPDGTYLLYVNVVGYQQYMEIVTINDDDLHIWVMPVLTTPVFPAMDIEDGSTRVIDLLDTVILAAPTEAINVNYTLPDAASRKDQEVVCRKINHNGSAVTLNVAAEDKVYYNSEGSYGLTTDEIGAWVVLKSDGSDWHVLMSSGNWQLTVSE